MDKRRQLLRVKQNVIHLPLQERVKQTEHQLFPLEKLIEIDGVGMYLKYSKKQEEQIKDESFLRSYLTSVGSTYAMIPADNIPEAIDIFLSEFEGANCGTTHKALWIESSARNPIRMYPKCKLMRVEKKTDNYRCGGYESGYNPPGCILNQYDPPEDCPIDKWLETYSDPVRVEELTHNEVKYYYVK